MQARSIDLASALATVHEHWRPKTLAALNDHEVRVARFQGEFVWHLHEDEDELFVPLRGSFRVEFRDHVEHLSPGQVLIVPRGVEHRPVADSEVECLLVQRAGVRNTGNVEHPTLTAPSTDGPP